jgi:hypothetical protein
MLGGLMLGGLMLGGLMLGRLVFRVSMIWALRLSV